MQKALSKAQQTCNECFSEMDAEIREVKYRSVVTVDTDISCSFMECQQHLAK